MVCVIPPVRELNAFPDDVVTGPLLSVHHE